MRVIGTVAPKAMSGLKDKASRAERLQKDHILASLPFCWVSDLALCCSVMSPFSSHVSGFISSFSF